MRKFNMKNNDNYFKKQYKKIIKIIKKKGFTLIELLAVIIILGVLLIIAIPSVTEYIQNSRKESYVAIAKEYIGGTRTIVNSGEMKLYEPDVTYYVPTTCITLEKGGDSPYGKFDPAYVVVTYTGSGYDYYFTGRDTSSMGIYLTYEGLLNIDSVVSGVTSIDTTIGVGDRENILRFTDSCKLEDAESYLATMNIPDKGKYGDNFKKTLDLYNIIVEKNKENDQMVIDNHASKYVSSNTGIDFNKVTGDTNGKGVYVRAGTENDNYPIYYYRGAVTDNNVVFAGFCWKIVRTTETGGIKLIYNGISTNGKCNNTNSASIIGESKFNEADIYNAYVGYMYGTPNSATYEEEHANINDSIIKTNIDTWYSKNMTSYTKYLEDTIWCNDRSFTDNNTGTGAGNSITKYAAYNRVGFGAYKVKPSLECINQNDRFTVNESMKGRINGNGKLTYPVALLTADEVTLAGNGIKANDSNTYLINGTYYWIMTPQGSGNASHQHGFGFVIGSQGGLGASAYFESSFPVRPSVSLQHETKIFNDGDGSANNPYFVDGGEYIIKIQGNNDIVLSKSKAFAGETITLKSRTMDIKNFKMNGQLIEGASFIMPEGNAVITNVTYSTTATIESEHNPYPNNIKDVIYGEKIFEGATSLTVTLDYQTESSSFDWISLYDSPTSTTPVNNKKYGGNTRNVETITINSNYVRIVFRTDGSVNNYYGFKATIIPNYE